MQKLNYSIDIKAPREQVWKILWDDATYRKWSSAFHEGSYAVSDWKEGSKILFLDPNGDGMSSIIEKKTPNEVMIFKHVGVAKNGKDAPIDDEAKTWVGAREAYKLSQTGEITKLKIEVDVAEKYLDEFQEAFPKALQNVKELSEKKREPAGVHG